MRKLRVRFSKAGSAEDYAEVARGTWVPGSEPVLTGEPIPPEVLKGLEAQICDTQDARGTVIYDRAEVRYAVEYEVVS